MSRSPLHPFRRGFLLWSFLVVLACLTSTAASAQPSGMLSASRNSSIDHAIDSTMRAHKIPALSLSITRAGAIVLERSYGLSDLEHSVAATNETLQVAWREGGMAVHCAPVRASAHAAPIE